MQAHRKRPSLRRYPRAARLSVEGGINDQHLIGPSDRSVSRSCVVCPIRGLKFLLDLESFAQVATPRPSLSGRAERIGQASYSLA